jgi:pyrroline-5-carboxylate reductase
MSLDDKHIGFIGAGAMAGALAGGLVAGGIARTRVSAADPDVERAALLAKELDIRVGSQNASLVNESDVVVIAVKPSVVGAALEPLRAAGVETSRPLWISIAAGVTLAQLSSVLGDGARIVRAMPNTPALVRSGATAICANARAGTEDRAAATTLFDSVGITWDCPSESLIDAVTGLSGSGPGYVFLFLEALIRGGTSQGLPADAARDLAIQTVLGAAKLAQETGRDPAALRKQVTSPNGTTEAGLAALRAGGFPESIESAIAAATARSIELGGSS